MPIFAADRMRLGKTSRGFVAIVLQIVNFSHSRNQKMKYRNLFFSTCVAIAGASGVNAQSLSLYECSLEAVPAAPSLMASEQSGTTYLSLSEDGRDVVRYDYKTGRRSGVVMSADKLRDCEVKSWKGFIVSPDEKLLLLYTDVQPIYRHSFKASYYIYDIARNNIRPLSENGTQEVPCFSPDSRMVAFVRENNIYIAKLDYGTEVAVTKDGKANAVINGVPDWVYQEEFGMQTSLTWSPDSGMLAFINWDETEVKMFNLPLYRGACSVRDEYAYYPGQFSYKYPVSGEVNSKVKVISYDVETRVLKTMNIPLDYDGYINKVEFGKTPDALMVNTLNRNQNDLKLYKVNPRSAVAKLLYSDKSDSWIDPDLTNMTKYYDSFFVVASERNGFRHLYQYSNAGSLMRQLTKGNWEVTDFYGYDAASATFYFQAAENGPLNRSIASVNAKGEMKLLSSRSGTNAAAFNADYTYYVRNYSDTKTPNVYTLCSVKGKELREVEGNGAYVEKYAGRTPEREFFTMKIKGDTLNGYMIKPQNFKEDKKYPVIMYQYSGPASQLVLNRWELGWLDYAATKGFLVVCVDGRGTGGRGKKFASVVYKNLGKYETEDQIAAAKYVASLPYVDKSKIGIFGWSYGGYETLMAMTAPENPYAAGIAVAPVTDWRFYDSIYSERFMQTPQQNPAGYEQASVLGRIGNLTGRLLVVSGTADDNVHISNTFELVSEATAMNKILDMMVYPNKDHHINGCETRFALYKKLMDFFERNLMNGQ